MDYKGADLVTKIGIASSKACANECWADLTCKSYTFSKAQGTCYLKGEGFTPVVSNCCVSGLRPCQAPPPDHELSGNSTANCGREDANMTYKGADLVSKFGISSSSACAAECWAELACKSYTFEKAQNTCYLKGEGF